MPRAADAAVLAASEGLAHRETPFWHGTGAADDNGPDGFNFAAGDGQDTGGVARVAIAVRAVDDPPAADDVAITIDEDRIDPGKPTATDVDGDPPTSCRATAPALGVAAVRSDVVVLDMPSLDDSGADTFTHSVGDGKATAARTA